MNITSKFSQKLSNIFSNEKKSSSSTQVIQASEELERTQERARKELLKLTKTSRNGFPFKPTCMAYDNLQHMLAIGTKYGYVKLYGGESVEYTLFHGGSGTSGSNSSNQSFGPVPTTCSNSLNNDSNNNSLSNLNNLNSNTVTNNNNNSNNNINNSANNNNPTSLSTLHAQTMSQSQQSSAALNFPSAVLFMTFVINEGALITYCDDNTLSFWNLRQKQPAIIFSKKLVNEKVTAMHLQFQSNWLYIGTEKGNTYLLNVYNNFSQSGYDIKWNNVIELSQKTKPGKVVHLSEQPMDSTKILIGFDSGLIVLWNLKLKRSEFRYYGTAETMSSISWFYEGKQFISGHNNGSLIVWGCKGDTKPVNILHPHMNETDLIPKYNMVKKVSWESTKNGDSLLIFSDGLPSVDCSIKDAITIIKNNKIKTIIEMKERVVDFICVTNSPWITDQPSDPNALIVLLEGSLVVIDLKTDGYPNFQYHHPIKLHESTITTCHYVVEPNRTFFQNLLQSHQQQDQTKKQQPQQQVQQVGNATVSTSFFSNLPYPINGGIKCTKSMFQYNELIATGHDDGSIKLWDASGFELNQIHKLKTQKIIDKRKLDGLQTDIDQPFKITNIYINGIYLAVSGAGGHVTLYKYYSKVNNNTGEEMADVPLLDIYLSESSNALNESSKSDSLGQQLNSETMHKKDYKCLLRTKIGFRKQEGFQPELVCLLYWSTRPPVVNAINFCTKNNILCFGTDESFVCVDFVNRTVLMNITVVDLYGNQESIHKNQKSPKKLLKSIVSSNTTEQDDPNSTDSPHLSKQHTVDYSKNERELLALRETLSRSSSGSSIENVSTTEGVNCISFNNPFPSNANNNQSQTMQIWVGTTYGLSIVLNLTTNNSNVNNNSSNSSMSQDILNSQKAQPSPTINPTGFIHSLKGQIVDIAFLDINGNLLPQTQNNGSETSSYQRRHNYQSASTSGAQNNQLVDDIGDLDIDFSYLSSNTVSNSIAENFGGSSSTAAAAAAAALSNLNDSASSSPTTTPTLIHQQTTSANDSDIFGTVPKEWNNSNNNNSKSTKTKKLLSATKSSKLEFGTTKDNSDSDNTKQPESKQFVVITSEQQIKIIALPSQTRIHKYAITEGIVAKASVVVINSLTYLSCYLTNGNFLVFNLPNPTLKSISTLNSPCFAIKEKEDRASKTFSFGAKGHALYMCSPTEIQKMYLSTNNGSINLSEMLCEFFDPKIVSPAPPKPNIFKSLFSVTPLDREELFGENSGKPSTCIVKNVDGEVQKTRKELSELQKLALERGEKLNALQMKTEEMTQAASAFAKNAHELANKYKSRKFF